MQLLRVAALLFVAVYTYDAISTYRKYAVEYLRAVSTLEENVKELEEDVREVQALHHLGLNKNNHTHTNATTTLEEEMEPHTKLVAQSSNSSTSKKEKPYLVLHVGPPKHATTYLQCVLSGTKARELMLQEDRYEYMGTAQCEGAHDESGLLSHTPTYSESIIEGGVNHNKHKPKLTKQFLQKLEYLEEHNINGLIVFEMLGGNLLMASSKYPQAFPLILNTVMSRFRVKIVINYKYLFDYITSMYNQHIKPTGKYNAENKNWPGQAGPDGKKGDYIRPFDTESQEALYYLKMIKRNRQSKTAIVRQKYIHAGVDPRDISILDMTVSHQTVLTALLCDHLPGASGACAHARAGTFPIPPKDKMSANPSFPINYDILATAAWKAGFVNTTNLSRGTVIQAIKTRQEKQLNRTLHDFPKTCMDTKKIQKLLTLSIEVDRNLFGTSQTREEALTQKFWDGKPTKLCSVDTNVVLADPEWRDWFANTTTMTM